MNAHRLRNILSVLLQMLLPWNCTVGAFCFMMYSASFWERMLHIEYGIFFALGIVFCMHCLRRLVIGVKSWRQRQLRHALACFLLIASYLCFAVFFIAPDFVRISTRYDGILWVVLANAFLLSFLGCYVGRGQLQSACSAASSDVPCR